MTRLIELRRLDIGQNDFIELPEVIGSFRNLTELWCDFNKLVTIPEVCFEAKNKLIYKQYIKITICFSFFLYLYLLSDYRQRKMFNLFRCQL